jgi:putative CocE/NonD family hydrolase
MTGMTTGSICPRTLAVLGLALALLSSPPGIAQEVAPDPFDMPAPLAEPRDPYWAKRIQGHFETRDGVSLHYSVLLPEETGRFPVIINYSGYDPGAIGGLEYRKINSAMSPNLDQMLLESGYAVMGVNARGTGCSEGTFDFLGPEYGRDGYDAVEFAAAQHWSNGEVGMANWSWAGMSQLMTASERPPSLRAIAPGMVLGDARRDSWAPGGVPAPGFVGSWRFYLASRWASVAESTEAEGNDKCLAQISRNIEGEEDHSITRLVLSHPLRDHVINQRAPGARVSRIQIPVLSMESFQDEAVTSRQDYYQERIDEGLIWLVQTSGGHNLYESRAFWPILIRFFDRFVKGIDNGFEATPRVTVWMETASDGKGLQKQEMADPRWTFSRPRIGEDGISVEEFRLGAGGVLTTGDVTDGFPDGFRYPEPGPAVATYDDLESWGPQPANWRETSLVYTSDPLSETILAYGSASADLWLSSTTIDADIQVTLTEVRPDGQEMFVQRGWLRLSNRVLDDSRSTPLRPVPVDWPEAIRPLNPGEPVLARIEVNKFAHAYRKGSQIRIWIDTPSPWGGYTFDYYAESATVKLWHDAEHLSMLRIGTLASIEVPDTFPPCGSVLQQPCRPDPLATTPD